MSPTTTTAHLQQQPPPPQQQQQSHPPPAALPATYGYELDNNTTNATGRPWQLNNNNDATRSSSSGSSCNNNNNNTANCPPAASTTGPQSHLYWHPSAGVQPQQQQQHPLSSVGFAPPPHHHSSDHYASTTGGAAAATAAAAAAAAAATTASELYGLANVEPNPHLYVHNVPKDATETELRDLFSTFGTVERIRLKVNQKVGPHALYAFVTYSTTPEAELALCRLNGYDIRGRKLRIEFQRNNSRGRSQQTEQDTGNNSSGSVGRHDDQQQQSAAAAPPLKRPRVSSDAGTLAQQQQQQYLPWPPLSGGGDESHQQPTNFLPNQLPPPQSFPSSQLPPPQSLVAGSNGPPQNSSPYIVNLFSALQQVKPRLFRRSTPPEQLPAATPAPPVEGGREMWWRVPPPGPIEGSLARNGKRRVPITLHPIFGPMPANGEFYNISHRGTAGDVSRRIVVAAALMTLAPTGGPASAPVTSDHALRSFFEHVSYLITKRRAGVVTIGDRMSLYLVPPGLPLFDSHAAQLNRPDLISQSVFFADYQNPICLIALFFAPSTPAPAAVAGAQQETPQAPPPQQAAPPAAAEPPEPGEVIPAEQPQQQSEPSAAGQQ